MVMYLLAASHELSLTTGVMKWKKSRVEKEKYPVNQREKHIAIEDVPTEIKDSDDILESEFFDTRQAFLSLCQGNHYQYDTLRRAKHSSMMILYHLHNPTVPAFATACAICQQELEPAQGWRCEVCPDYEVCCACYSKGINHPHSLISLPAATDSVVPNTKTNQTAQLFPSLLSLRRSSPATRYNSLHSFRLAHSTYFMPNKRRKIVSYCRRS
ncbi:hypothetical protein Bca52824_021027 [Brassica carinata]|uniref:histone acetyltransferase n=1 Tax=Brassica carinata TaxID=52824 RepID=A0A8X8B063_BRACI|nr:hypothetical protein Bca52824_021027 [Brassica carinata]